MQTVVLIFGLAMLAGTSLAQFTAHKPLSEDEVGLTLQRLHKSERVECGILLRALVSSQTYLRARAAHKLEECDDEAVVPALIVALSDESFHEGVDYPKAGMMTTRWWANESLKKLTRQDFGFRWDAPRPEREAAIILWKEWLAASTSR